MSPECKPPLKYKPSKMCLIMLSVIFLKLYYWICRKSFWQEIESLIVTLLCKMSLRKAGGSIKIDLFSLYRCMLPTQRKPPVSCCLIGHQKDRYSLISHNKSCRCLMWHHQSGYCLVDHTLKILALLGWSHKCQYSIALTESQYSTIVVMEC